MKHLPGFTHLFIVIICSLTPAQAQFVTIPDANFISWLNANGFAACMSGNQMDTTCPAIVNATKVNCNNNNLSSIEGISYFDNLDTLECAFNQLTSLPPLPSGLQRLRCFNNDLAVLPDLPATLVRLDCQYNNLTALPALPPGLTRLETNSNQITALPALPVSLTYLNCDHNQITSIPSLGPGVSEIYCDYNQLSSLPALPNALIYLRCGNNPLTALPSLPNSLVELQCPDALLTTLPVLPNSLTTLHCRNNQLTSIPTLPSGIYDLQFQDNQVSALPSLPNSIILLAFDLNQISNITSLPSSLQLLYCAGNQLTALPALPGTLQQLWCGLNQLTGLPALPASLTHLYAQNNPLTSLPELPDSMNTLNINDNNNLHCLPELKIINTFNFTNSGIQCLPNYGTITNSNPAISSVPLCDLFNANACPAFWNISGMTYHDANNNCVANTNELRMGNLKVLLDSMGTPVQQTYTGGDGHYSFDTGTGNFSYRVDTTGLPVYVSCPVSGIRNSVLTAIDSTDLNMDFALRCKPGFDVGARSAVRDSGTFRPAHFSQLRIGASDMSRFFGLSCANGTAGQVKVIVTGPVTYMGPAAGALVPVLSGDTLIYTIANFGTVNFDTDFRFTVQTDTTAPQGSAACFDVLVSPVAGDLYPANNQVLTCFNIVNSYDPNVKEVSPSGVTSPTQEWLTYTIHFQNTGTAPAEHIYITDTLDQNVIASSLQLRAYSHSQVTQVTGNVVRFNFPAINLPDSTTDEPNSHGYVQFRVRMVPGLADGTLIQNTGNIFFDFNPPVITNTVVNLIQGPTGISPAAQEPSVLRLFPNPVAGHQVTVRNSHSGSATFELHDFAGRSIFNKRLDPLPEQRIQLPANLSGMYLCTLRTEKAVTVVKLVVGQD